MLCERSICAVPDGKNIYFEVGSNPAVTLDGLNSTLMQYTDASVSILDSNLQPLIADTASSTLTVSQAYADAQVAALSTAATVWMH